MEQTAKIKRFITLNLLLVCFVVYAICYFFRLIEYLVLRTDEGTLGENLVHKIAGIAIIFIVLRILYLRWRDIGFRSKHWLKNIGLGLCLRISVRSSSVNMPCLSRTSFLNFSATSPDSPTSPSTCAISRASTSPYSAVDRKSVV